jgi:hypothetical protein
VHPEAVDCLTPPAAWGGALIGGAQIRFFHGHAAAC